MGCLGVKVMDLTPTRGRPGRQQDKSRQREAREGPGKGAPPAAPKGAPPAASKGAASAQPAGASGAQVMALSHLSLWPASQSTTPQAIRAQPRAAQGS